MRWAVYKFDSYIKSVLICHVNSVKSCQAVQIERKLGSHTAQKDITVPCFYPDFYSASLLFLLAP